MEPPAETRPDWRQGVFTIALANLMPKFINFSRGALITGVVGVLIMPWNLIATPQLYIFTWLGVVAGLLGTVAGILIADYWIIRRTRLDLAGLLYTALMWRTRPRTN